MQLSEVLNTLEPIPIKPLKLVVKEIFSGAPLYSITKLSFCKDGIPILNIKNIVDGKIIKDSLRLFSLDNFKNATRYMAHPGDVLITCRGTQLKVTVVPENIKQILITSNLIAIRLNEELLPMYLSAYFKTKDGQRALLSNTTSSTLQLVLNMSDIEKVNVPVPPLSLQEKIIDLFNTTEEQYRLSIESANMRRAITDQIITGMLKK
jgi:restriction endonuclease S subunit